jgi:hypothetical protein
MSRMGIEPQSRASQAEAGTLSMSYLALRSGQFGGQKSLGPLDISDYEFCCPHKKIAPWTIRISGAYNSLSTGDQHYIP